MQYSTNERERLDLSTIVKTGIQMEIYRSDENRQSSVAAEWRGKSKILSCWLLKRRGVWFPAAAAARVSYNIYTPYRIYPFHI